MIYEYVEPTYVHGDAHDMTDGKEIIEIIETEELGEMDEIEEAEGTEVTGVKEIDIHRTPVSSTSEVQSEKQDSKEIVAQTDEGLNSGIQNLNSDVDNSVTKNDRRAVDVSGESDRSPISGDEGEETSVKTLRKDTKVNSETGSVKDTKSVDARPKERVKKKVKARLEIEPEPPPEQSVLRRSERQRKSPAWHDSYHMSSMVIRPYDNKLESLNILLQSGVIGKLDSEIAHKLIKNLMD